MHCARIAVATVFVSFFAAPAGAQPTQAPRLPSVLAGKKFTPPLRGEAIVEYTRPTTRRVKDMVITSFKVRNVSADAPIARLSIRETWYDKAGQAGNVVTIGTGVINGLIQPGEIQDIAIETPFRPEMNANNFNFNHANGTVKPVLVPKLEAPLTPPDPAKE